MCNVTDTIAALARSYVATRSASRLAVSASQRVLAPLYDMTPLPDDATFAAARAAAGLATITEEAAMHDRAVAAGRRLGAALRRIATRENITFPVGASDREIADIYVGR